MDKGCPQATEEVQVQGMESGGRDLVKTLLKAQVKAHPSALISPVKIYSFLREPEEGSMDRRGKGRILNLMGIA